MRRALTLIELVVVVGIVLILVALVTSSFSSIISRSEAAKTETAMQLLGAAVDAYEADPDCGFALRAGAWHTVLRGITRSQCAHARRRIPVDLPLLVIAGGDDPMGQFGRGPERLARALEGDGQRDLQLRVYEGRRHELLHDSAADTVTDDIRNWIDARLAEQPAAG